MKELIEEIGWDWNTFKQILWVVFWALLLTTIFGFVFGWISLPFRKGDVNNVEKQFTFGYEQINAMKSTAQSICFSKIAVDSETNPDLKSQRTTQLLAYESNYTRLQAGYDAWSQNIFTGKVIRPSDLPYRAPPLKDMQAQVCNQ